MTCIFWFVLFWVIINNHMYSTFEHKSRYFYIDISTIKHVQGDTCVPLNTLVYSDFPSKRTCLFLAIAVTCALVVYITRTQVFVKDDLLAKHVEADRKQPIVTQERKQGEDGIEPTSNVQGRKLDEEGDNATPIVEDHEHEKSPPDKKPKAAQNVYTIAWNHIVAYHTRYPEAFHCGFDTCEYSNCKLLIGKQHAPLSDAVIFDGRSIKPDDFFHRKPGQIWIFAAHEAPISYMDNGGHWTRGDWVSSFNWTMTYDRFNTDIYLPYGEIRKRPDSVVKDYKPLFKRKNKTALIVHSHCHTHSRRAQYVSRLHNYTDLHSFGKCGKPFKCGVRLKHDKCFDVINDYKFYLAFENAFCDEYFTEKLFSNFNYDSIMVVRGGRHNGTKHALPTGTYISADDFKSIKSLADYLNRVASSEELYTELLVRKDEYYSVPYKVVYQRAMCDICERMNKQEHYRKLIPNIVEWAFGKDPCLKRIHVNLH